MSNRTFYEILGVPKDADEKAIKKAYKRLAIRYHPDRNSGDKEAESKFKEIKLAYEVLSDPEKRSRYDAYGHDAFTAAAQGFARGGYESDFAGGFGDVFGDLFGDLFGGRHAAEQQRTGNDLLFRTTLTLQEAARGVQKTIELTTKVHCDHCKGSGAKPGTSPQSCRSCQGKGRLILQKGFFQVQQTCPTCHGTGQQIKEHCSNCRGTGTTRKSKKLSVDIPAGADTGNKLRLQGEGEAGPQGGKSGDLFIEIVVEKHPIFDRDGDALHCVVPISFVQAALGASIDVPTLDGRVTLTVPPETQTGKIFRLTGKGMPNLRNRRRGDLFCKIVVETPVHLTAEQKACLLAFDKSFQTTKEPAIHHPKWMGFLSRVKQFFEELTSGGKSQ